MSNCLKIDLSPDYDIIYHLPMCEKGDSNRRSDLVR